MDFVSDQLANSLRFRTLNVVDDCSREALVIEVARSLPGSAVVNALEAVAELRGYPEQIVIDNGPEFRGRILDAWAYEHGVELRFIEPGKPITERVRRKFQRSVPRRVSQPALVRQPGRRPAHNRTMAPGLQHGATPQLARQSNTS